MSEISVINFTINGKAYEGIGNRKIGYHVIQKRLAEHHGTQCGFCSPGMVMNMFSLYEAKKGDFAKKDVENSFGGNICRCTGYRPILDAFKSLAEDANSLRQDYTQDIEDFSIKKICSKTKSICYGHCSIFLDLSSSKKWYQVSSVEEILQIFRLINNEKYMLIGGNTSQGLYKRSPDIEIFIDTSKLRELHVFEIQNDCILIGANVSLSDAFNGFIKASEKPGFEYCKQLANHIDKVANVPVRNTATIAGNLCIKHDHPEFPSDIFLILTIVGAEIYLSDDTGGIVKTSLEDFLKTPLHKKLITKLSLQKISNHKFMSYKIMPRAQNALAYVNAAFLFEMNNTTVINSKISYGGLSSEFLNFDKTTNYLKGKNMIEKENVKTALEILSNEIQIDLKASEDYKKKLTITLLYRFILSIIPNNKMEPRIKCGRLMLQRPLSSGCQTFDTNEKKWPMTQPIQKVEGLFQCSGEAQYVNDIPYQPHELWAAFVTATKTHSIILSIDTNNALSIPGVHFFFSAKDIPGKNNFSPLNLSVAAEEIFCAGPVKFHGQPIGVILADSFALANYASSLVQIEYKSTRKPVIPTVAEALENKAEERFLPACLINGNQLKGAKSDKIIEGHFEMKGQYHFTMETQTTLCVPSEDGLNVYSSTQWIDLVQAAISQCLNIPESSINMEVKRLGGAFGCKISRATQVACASAIACKLTNRPVRFVLSLESNMKTIGKRNGVICDYEAHVSQNGKIVRLVNNFSEDYGCSPNDDVVNSTIEAFTNCYQSSTWKVQGKPVITDSASNTWCRAPGTTEGIAMIENIMEHISRILQMDPVDVRLSNIDESSKMKTLLPEFLSSVEYHKRKSNIENFNKQNLWRKRGIAVVPMHYPQEFFGSIPVVVSIYHTDGTVAISHGGIECGQGINTKVIQVASHTLGISMDYIKVKPALNYTTPNSTVTGGSMTSEAVCYATMKACEKLLERMQPVKQKMASAKWEQITEECFKELIDLSASHLYKMTEVQKYSTWGVSCAEVEIDILTGNYLLTRVDILEDTGESISPQIDVGQVEGAFVMGLGYWLTENLIYDKNSGELLTAGTLSYHPPCAKDIPIDFRISFLRNSSNQLSVLRSKATGEPALCMAVVVIFAIRHALDSVRKDFGLEDEWYDLKLPATPENVLLAAGIKLENLIL